MGFNDRGTKQFLKNIDVAAIELIKSEQPFFIRKDGTPEGITQSPLWHLKELSDIDKHRTLHIMTTALPAHNLQFPTVAQSFTTVDVQEYSGGPIQQDTVLWTGILHGAKSWPFGGDPIRWTVDLSGFVLRSSSSSEKTMIHVEAVGNLAFLARFPNPCGRVLCVHRGGSVHIVFDVAKSFNGVTTSGTMRTAKLRIPEWRPSSIRLLLGHPGRFVDPADPRDRADHAQCSFPRPERNWRSNSAGLT